LEGVFVKGLPPEGPGTPNVTAIRQHAVTGDFTFATPDGKRRGAVVGVRLAERLGVTPKMDSITLMTISPSGIDPVTGFPAPQIATFEVTGTFDTGLYEYDNSYVIISLDAAQQLAGLGAAVTGIEVKAPTRDAAPAVGARIQDSLGPRFAVRDWHQQNNALFTALKLEKLGMSVSLLLIAIVAAFNIVSTLIMVVTDKTKEIGILRAMGMSARSIRLVFFAQGMVIGVVGTALGLATGLALSALIGREKLITLDPTIYFIDHLPVATQPLDVALIMLASLGIAALATIYPARRAASLLPVEAIRHE
jgi:lipoprotein-releasing system permease protein